MARERGDSQDTFWSSEHPSDRQRLWQNQHSALGGVLGVELGLAVIGTNTALESRRDRQIMPKSRVHEVSRPLFVTPPPLCSWRA